MTLPTGGGHGAFGLGPGSLPVGGTVELTVGRLIGTRWRRVGGPQAELQVNHWDQ